MSGSPDTDGKNSMAELLGIVGRLRGEGGCPWDREQTLDTLKQYLIEESYEVLDAIDSGNAHRHAEELGDVLLQILMHAQIRAEKNEFTFDTVARGLADKLIRRHPHVFGNAKAENSKEVLKNWESIKSEEKKAERESIMDGIPRHMPALQRAQRVQSRASHVGFDWTELKDVLAKVDEETAEVKQAIGEKDPARIGEEIGDLLFAAVNLARFQGINAEECLDGAIKRFVSRFQQVETLVRKEGRQLKDCTLAELDAHWEAVKSGE